MTQRLHLTLTLISHHSQKSFLPPQLLHSCMNVELYQFMIKYLDIWVMISKLMEKTRSQLRIVCCTMLGFRLILIRAIGTRSLHVPTQRMVGASLHAAHMPTCALNHNIWNNIAIVLRLPSPAFIHIRMCVSACICVCLLSSILSVDTDFLRRVPS
jgi:hypothetical protein